MRTKNVSTEQQSPFIHCLGCTFDISTIHGRMAARALAYSLLPEKPDEAKAILDDKRVGREG